MQLDHYSNQPVSFKINLRAPHPHPAPAKRGGARPPFLPPAYSSMREIWKIVTPVCYVAHLPANLAAANFQQYRYLKGTQYCNLAMQCGIFLRKFVYCTSAGKFATSLTKIIANMQHRFQQVHCKLLVAHLLKADANFLVAIGKHAAKFAKVRAGRWSN